MIPQMGLGLLGLAALSGGLAFVRKERTDADRLRDLDAAEQAHIAYKTNPHVIAAAERRERRRLKRLAA